MPSRLAGLIPEDSRRCAICRALNPASIRIRHCLVATREQLPPLPLPRTVKLNTPHIKAYKESEANQEMEGWKRNGRVEGWKGGRMEGWKEGRMEGWKGGRMEGWKDGRMEGWKDQLHRDHRALRASFFLLPAKGYSTAVYPD